MAEAALAVCGRARGRVGPTADQLKALQEESRNDPIAEEAVATALTGDTLGDTGIAEAKDLIERVENWAHAILARRSASHKGFK